MNDIDVERIVNAYLHEPTIETPFGTMIGKPAPEGSTIPYAEYTMEYEGETIIITGLGWGHGTLFIGTEGGLKGRIGIPYEITQQTEYTDEDESEDEDEGEKPSPQCTLDAYGVI